MAQVILPSDFKEFLRLLNFHNVEYLLIGGYAVGHYGHVRYTADIDIWIEPKRETAEKIVAALNEFGFDTPTVTPDLFLNEKNIVRLGMPPMRIEIANYIDGVEFGACYARRIVDEIDGVPVSMISLDDLKANKRASGRLKDLADLENLP